MTFSPILQISFIQEILLFCPVTSPRVDSSLFYNFVRLLECQTLSDSDDGDLIMKHQVPVAYQARAFR